MRVTRAVKGCVVTRTCVSLLLLTSSSVRLCSVPTASGSVPRLLCASVSVCSSTTSHQPASALGAEKSITTSRERLGGSAVASTPAGTYERDQRGQTTITPIVDTGDLRHSTPP